MTVTALLLFPVGAILVWGYARLRPPGRWELFDSLVVAASIGGALWAAHTALVAQWEAVGPIWPSVAAALAAYLVLLAGLGAGLWARHRAHGS